MRALLALAIAFTSVVACGGSNKPVEQPPVATAPTAAPPPACNEAPANPTEAMAKEPQVLSACLAGAAKLDANLCGQAKIAFEIGKDGRVTRAEVASSTLPVGVTDCIKARLAALQYACPKEGTAAYTLPVGLPTGSATGACPGLPAQ
jgi:hypothetical protein